MKQFEIVEGITRLTANVHDILFESLWPLPEGMAMNSYLVKGERLAIVDGVCGWDGVPEHLFGQLDSVGVHPRDVQAVILNHLEPDHAGWLEPFLKLNRDVEIIATDKGLQLARAFFPEVCHCQTRAVHTGDTLDLGGGRVLAFTAIPNVHWPETMATFDLQTGTLMPGDAFGAFGAVDPNQGCDDQLSESALHEVEENAIRYFSNIITATSPAVQRALDTVAGLDLKVIAPGHGIVWRKNPQRILDLYRWLSGLASGPAEPRVTVLWSSMYGMSQKILAPLMEGVRSSGVEVDVFNVPETHVSFILASVLQSQGVVIATPTYEYKMFTPMAHVLDYLGRKRILNRDAVRMGSFGWSGGAQKELESILERHRMNWSLLDPVEFKGMPSDGDMKSAHARGVELGNLVQERAVSSRPRHEFQVD